MIFSWFRSKKLGEHEERFSQLIALDNNTFIDVVGAMIAKQHGASNAMCLVALQNIGPILSATQNFKNKNPEAELPSSIEDHVRLMSQTLDAGADDEIGVRRGYWFLYSLLIKRASELSRSAAPPNVSCIKMWCSLVDGGRYLCSSLEHNVIWSNEEKEWFVPITTEKDGVKFVLNYMLPEWLKKNQSIRQFAESADVRLVAGHYF